MSMKPPSQPQHKRWIAAFFIVGIIGIFLTGWLAKRTSDLQDQASSDIHKAEVAATNANIAATNANISATNAHQETMEARKDLQNLQNTVNTRAKETNTTITKWQSDTEGAVGKLLRPARVLSADQIKIIVKILKTVIPTEIAIRHTEGCIECQQYADQLAETIKQAGWTIQTHPRFLIQEREALGLWIMIRDVNKIPLAADKLIKALTAAGIKNQGIATEVVAEGRVEIMVGLP